MRISCFNINKFCGPYSNRGGYYNPRNIDFRTPIKNIVVDFLKDDEDIFFLEEFTDNRYINVFDLFSDYNIFFNGNELTKSHVVAITLKGKKCEWEQVYIEEAEYYNKYIRMYHKDKNICISCFHNTNVKIQAIINECFSQKKDDIILGDFNRVKFINLQGYRDLVTQDMITFKPAQTTVDHIFVKDTKENNNKIVFNGVFETFVSDHNLLTFSLNV